MSETGGVPMRYEGEDYEPELPPISERSRTVALILGCLGGFLGFHRFYVGRIASGVAQALTLGGLGMWWLYDMVVILAGEFRDADELPLRNWNVAEGATGSAAGLTKVNQQQLREVIEQMDRVQHQLGELAERMDFAERMLTQQRNAGRLTDGSR